MSNKVGIRANKIDKRQKEALHNDKRINPLGSHHDAPNNRASKYMKQSLIELKEEITTYVIIVGGLQHPPLSKG